MDTLKKNLNTAALVLIAAGLARLDRLAAEKDARPRRPRARRRRPGRLRRPQPDGPLPEVPAQVPSLFGEPGPRRRARAGHPRPGQLFPLQAQCPDGLHGGQAPQPVRPVRHRAQGPQDGRLVQGLLPRGQLPAGRPWRTCSSSTPTTPRGSSTSSSTRTRTRGSSSATTSPRTGRRSSRPGTRRTASRRPPRRTSPTP